MRHFVEELEQLKSKLLEMSGLVEAAIYRSVSSVIDRDAKQAFGVIEGEARVNKLESEIDDMAIALLALQAPVSRDLRLITVALKINNDLERMGDLAARIARRSLVLINAPAITAQIDLPRLAEQVQTMVRQSLDAFVNGDVALAEAVLASDESVDKLRDSQTQDLIAFMQADSEHVRQAVELLSIVRHLERIGDHATNIAEDVFYLVKGVPVRRSERLPLTTP